MDPTPTPNEPASRVFGGRTLHYTRLDLAAYLFSSNVSWMALAFIFTQSYTYHRRSHLKPDVRYIQTIVYGLVVLQICQTALDSLFSYRGLVYNWGDSLDWPQDMVGLAAGDLLLLTDALTGAVVQYFYIRRIWTFSTVMLGPKTKRLARTGCMVIGMLPLVTCGSALVYLIVPYTNDPANINTYYNAASAFWAGSSAIADIVLTACMLIILYHAATVAHEYRVPRNRFADVFHVTVQTGFITALLAILILILLLGLHSQTGEFYGLPQVLLGKSYLISLLSILNARGRSEPRGTDEYSLWA